MPGHDCITRVPFIIRYPEKIPAGKEIKDLTEAVDFVPTMLDFAGIQIPSFIQGKSLKPLLENKSSSPLRDDILIEHFAPGEKREITVKTAEYMYYCNSGGKELLFDRKKDPDEITDVSAEMVYRSALADMRKRMIVRMQNSAWNNQERIVQY